LEAAIVSAGLHLGFGILHVLEVALHRTLIVQVIAQELLGVVRLGILEAVRDRHFRREELQFRIQLRIAPADGKVGERLLEVGLGGQTGVELADALMRIGVGGNRIETGVFDPADGIGHALAAGNGFGNFDAWFHDFSSFNVRRSTFDVRRSFRE
jgi:hypothetical protein